jgi:hypothetical protein
MFPNQVEDEDNNISVPIHEVDYQNPRIIENPNPHQNRMNSPATSPKHKNKDQLHGDNFLLYSDKSLIQESQRLSLETTELDNVLSHNIVQDTKNEMNPTQNRDLPPNVNANTTIAKPKLFIDTNKSDIIAFESSEPTKTETPNFSQIQKREFLQNTAEHTRGIEEQYQNQNNTFGNAKKKMRLHQESQIINHQAEITEMSSKEDIEQNINDDSHAHLRGDISEIEDDKSAELMDPSSPEQSDYKSEIKLSESENYEVTKTNSQNGEKCCRICLDSEETKESGKLIRPCQCDGSMKFVHEECLKTWIISKGIDLEKVKCEVCNVMFVMNFVYGTKFYPKVACEEGLMSFLSCICLSGMVGGLIMIIIVIVSSW